MRKIKGVQVDKALQKSWQLKEAKAYADWAITEYDKHGEPEYRDKMYNLYVERYLYNLARHYVYEQTQFALHVMATTEKFKKFLRLH